MHHNIKKHKLFVLFQNITSVAGNNTIAGLRIVIMLAFWAYVWLNRLVQKLGCTFFVLKQVDLTQSITMKEEYMQKQNLFVGSLAYATADDSLKAFFEQIGEVERASVATDRETGRSRGFGFVTFVNEENNQKAVEVVQSSQRLVYQAPKQTSHASIACLYDSLHKCRHSLQGHREFRSTGTAKEYENYKYIVMLNRLQLLSNRRYLKVTHTFCK